MKVDNKLTNYDLTFDYLLLNSEFEFDSDLNGFIINAIQPGNVNLRVIFYFIHIILNSVLSMCPFSLKLVYFQDCGIGITCRNYIYSQNYTGVNTYIEIAKWSIQLNQGINNITLNETISCKKGYMLLLIGLKSNQPNPNGIQTGVQNANQNMNQNAVTILNAVTIPIGNGNGNQLPIIFGERNIQSSQEDLKIISNINNSLSFDSNSTRVIFRFCVKLQITRFYFSYSNNYNIYFPNKGFFSIKA